MEEEIVKLRSDVAFLMSKSIDSSTNEFSSDLEVVT